MRNIPKELGLREENGLIYIPKYATKVSIDVGLSVNAPQSATWLEQDPDLFVIGFEPIQSNIDLIHQGNAPWPKNLQPSMIGERICIVKAALAELDEPKPVNFFVTKLDPGCSSFLKPVSFEIDRVELVSVFKLDTILEHFPYNRIHYIEHLKIDAQGTDFNVLKGAIKNLSRILFVTLEIDTINYIGSQQSEGEVNEFLSLNHFYRINNSILGRIIRKILGIRVDFQTDDPTYINLPLYSKLGKPKKWIFQRG
jgi:FkbM family methyltransferase